MAYAYATVEELEASFRPLDSDEKALAENLLETAAVIIDAHNSEASEEARIIVSCNMVKRAIGDGNTFPMGASQGSMSAGGYTQSWTVGSGGAVGELYLNKLDKKLLGYGCKIGSYSPLEEMR